MPDTFPPASRGKTFLCSISSIPIAKVVGYLLSEVQSATTVSAEALEEVEQLTNMYHV